MPRLTVNATNQQADIVEDMVESGTAANQSEAIKQLMNEGAPAFGYVGTTQRRSPLRWAARMLGRMLGLAGTAALGLTIFAPLEARLIAFATLLAALACYGVDSALARVPTAVGARVRALWGGQDA